MPYMNPPPLAPSPETSAPRASAAMTIMGAFFIIGWLTVSAVWFMMSMMGTLMANDSGAASANSHMTLILAMIFGQGMTSLAGVFAGMAFFRRARRRLLLWLFGVLLVVGVASQVGGLQLFFSSAGALP